MRNVGKILAVSKTLYFTQGKESPVKKKVKKLGLHVETVRQLTGNWCENVVGGALTQAAGTVCTTCTHVCSACRPCA